MKSSDATMQAVSSLHTALLDAWNKRDAREFASLFTDDGNVVGFDGSQLDGRNAIQEELTRIFSFSCKARGICRR